MKRIVLFALISSVGALAAGCTKDSASVKDPAVPTSTADVRSPATRFRNSATEPVWASVTSYTTVPGKYGSGSPGYAHPTVRVEPGADIPYYFMRNTPKAVVIQVSIAPVAPSWEVSSWTVYEALDGLPEWIEIVAAQGGSIEARPSGGRFARKP